MEPGILEPWNLEPRKLGDLPYPQKRFGQLTMKREQIEDLGMHEQPDLVELCTTHYNA